MDLITIPEQEDLDQWISTIKDRCYDSFDDIEMCLRCMGRKKVDAIIPGEEFGYTRCPECMGTGLNVYQLVTVLLKTLAEDA